MAKKDMTKLIKYGKSLGFEVTKTNSGHILFTGYGRRMFSSSTPSDFRVIPMLRKNLQKISQGKSVSKL